MLASVSGSITSQIASHGVYAVFVLMAIDAVFPAASELVILYGGAIAGAGWALGKSYERFDHGFRYAEYVVVAVVLLGLALLAVRWIRSSRLGPRANDPAR